MWLDCLMTVATDVIAESSYDGVIVTKGKRQEGVDAITLAILQYFTLPHKVRSDSGGLLADYHGSPVDYQWTTTGIPLVVR